MNKKILLRTVLALSIFGFGGNYAYAACDQTPQSIQEAFAEADVVFKGAFKEKKEAYYVFTIKELFKTTHKPFAKAKEVKINSEAENSISFPEAKNIDWVVYGTHKKIQKENIVEASSCSKTYLSPFSYLSYTRENKEKLKQDLVFVGELLRIERSDYDKSKDVEQSKLFFRVNDLIKDGTEKQNYQNIREVMINVISCSNLLHVGHEYVVSADMKSVPVTTKNGEPYKDSDGQFIETKQAFMECTQHSPIDLSLSSYLRSLDKKEED